MGKKARSAKGEMVDFDILKIKEVLATAPKPLEVRERQDFIENRLRRKLKTPAVPEIEVTKILPTPDDDLVENSLIDIIKPPETVEEASEEQKQYTKKTRKKPNS